MNVSANFLILSDSLLSNYFSVYGHFEENNMMLSWRQITSLCPSRRA